MRYKVKLYTLPARSLWTTPGGPAPTHSPGFTVDARNVDKGMGEVRKRLVDRGYRVRSISCATDGGFVAYVEEVEK